MRSLCGVALVALIPILGSAHDSLYHYAEVTRAPGSGSVEIAFSIHIGDLPGARAFGAEETSNSLACLKGRGVDEIEALCAEAAALLAETVRIEEGDGDHWTFPDALELSRDPSAFEGARPGFLIATLKLSTDGAPPCLRYLPEAQKRLLLVVPRPGQFPIVRDLGPGASELLTTTASSSRP